MPSCLSTGKEVLTLVMIGGKPKQITYKWCCHMVTEQIACEHMKTAVGAFPI